MTLFSPGASDGGNSDAATEQEIAQRVRRDLGRFLRIRERTCREVSDYLKRRGHPAHQVKRALAELIETGLVDDRRFARLYLQDRRRLKPMSQVAVLRALCAKGVERALAEEALAACDPPWDDEQLAMAAVARRWERWRQSERQAKAIRYLQARGFASGTIRLTLDQLETPGESSIGEHAEHGKAGS